MKTLLIIVFSALVTLQVSAQSPRELWNQIPTAADSVAVCKTDTAKVRRYLESLDAFVKRADALIAEIDREALSKVDVMRREAIENSPVPARNTQADAALAARLNNMTEAQREAEGKKMAEQAFGMNIGDMEKMAKKMENASEEEQMAMAMQMISGMDLSNLEATSYVPDEDQIAAMEIRQKISEIGISEIDRQKILAGRADSSLGNYEKAYEEAYLGALNNFEPYDGPARGDDSPEVQNEKYRNFRNAYCPAVTPVSVRYMNAKITELAAMLDYHERREALSRQLAEVEPTETNRQIAQADRKAGYECVRKYAIELKRRYEAYYWLYRWDGLSVSTYRINMPANMQVKY